MELEEEDRLSNLPKIFLDNILSRLPEKDASRTSVLSKAWLDTWYTFPILSFSDTKIPGTFPHLMEDFQRKRKYFIDYVTRRLLRFYDKGLAIKEFKLSVDIFELPYMSKDVDHWLKLTSESGVEVLSLFLPNRGECYVLPNGVIEVKSLTKLALVGGVRVDQALMNHSIKFFSLRELYFWRVPLGDEQAIEYLISRCPLIECITLNFLLLSTSDCGMKSLSMHGLLKLKTVDVQGIKEVHIDEAPSLENFNCDHGDWDTPFMIEFIRCRNLKGLCLFSWNNTIMTDKWFLDLFRKFPFLERLKLQNCKMSERINISSVQLKVLELSHCYNLKEVDIDAPNLLSCDYRGRGVSKPIIYFLRGFSQLEVNVQIHLDYLDICNLGGFLQNIKPQNILTSLSLFIFQLTMDALDPVVYQVSSPPPSVKHLHIRSFPKNETLFLSAVNILLSSCCPATISFSLHPNFCSRAFIKFFYETLMERKGGDCFCISCDTKCWWHVLKDVKVTSSMKIDENVDLKTILESLSTFPDSDREKINFILEF